MKIRERKLVNGKVGWVPRRWGAAVQERAGRLLNDTVGEVYADRKQQILSMITSFIIRYLGLASRNVNPQLPRSGLPAHVSAANPRVG